MQRIVRREFLKTSLLPTAVPPLLASQAVAVHAADKEPPVAAAEHPGIIDTNVHLFDWPFRSLKYRQTADLVAKLRKHRVTEACAGSFQALLHKNLDSANARLANECRVNSEGMLLPFGSVNPVWPDWEEDLRRSTRPTVCPASGCTRITTTTVWTGPRCCSCSAGRRQRGLLVQIAIEMEDERVHHPVINVPPVDARRWSKPGNRSTGPGSSCSMASRH